MNTELNSALYKSGVRVFEDLGFMLPTPELDQEQKNAPFSAAAEVEFDGRISGTLVLSLYGDLLALLTANMLGQTELPTADQQQDALRELANVVCGNVLPHVSGVDAVFEIRTPRFLTALPSTSHNAVLPPSFVEIGLDQGRAGLHLFLKTHSAERK